MVQSDGYAQTRRHRGDGHPPQPPDPSQRWGRLHLHVPLHKLRYQLVVNMPDGIQKPFRAHNVIPSFSSSLRNSFRIPASSRFTDDWLTPSLSAISATGFIA